MRALWKAARRNLLRPLRLASEMYRGDDYRRHVSRAQLRAHGHRAVLAAKRAAIRARGTRRPILLVGMVEHMGDIVAAEPVARHLRAENPDAYLVWAVHRKYREVIESNPHIDAALLVDCLTEWIELREIGRFDRVVDLQIHNRFCERCEIRLTQPDDRRTVDTANYYDFGCLLEIFCWSAGLPLLQDTPRVYIPDRCRARVDRLGLPDRFVVIHTTANVELRDWEAKKWQELVERITRELGATVVEVGLHPLIDASSAGYISLCGKLSLLETAEVIRRAELFIGIDSGPAHLANAVETYGVILLGHYLSFEKYLPYSGGYATDTAADVIRADGPASTIPVERVLASVEKKLKERSEQPARRTH